MIVVDTSVWIDLLAKRDTPQATFMADRLLAEDEDFALTDIVLTEILQGLRTEQQVVKIESYLTDFDVLRLRDFADFRLAAAMYRTARRRGITIRRTSDCLIAAVCVRENVPLLHSDTGFDQLASVTDLRIARLV